METIAKRAEAIRIERARRRLSVRQLAETAGISRVSLWRCEAGRPVSGRTLRAVQRALEIEDARKVTSSQRRGAAAREGQSTPAPAARKGGAS